uniref:RELT like 2 n=1 Tax=Salarias fasciatus TaxID=181472 RepID=A0A672H2R3_SALFA
MSELEASGAGEPPPYIIFVVVFFFFVTGLLGFLVCHLLKKKGYRCRAGDMEDEEEEAEKLGGDDDEYEENQDTVEQILKCIIENEANMEAFNEMLGNRNLCVRHDPRLRKDSIAGIPPHHHTVHSGMDHNTCHLCAQIRTKKGRRPSRTPRFKQRPGEQTVFAVGRFRVTHTDKKPQGSPNPLAISGDQLDQSQDSEDRKEGGYNLRSMFKDVRPPSENANGVAPSAGKRRKSLTMFGLRRGSDPVGVKVIEGSGRETGGLKFAVQQPPVVLEEPLQTHEMPASKPKSETLPGKMSQRDAKTPDPVNSPSSQVREQARDSSSGPEETAKVGSRIMIPASTSSTAGSAPSSLPILSGKRIDVGDRVLNPEGAYDPGPLQTSTPIAPMPESIPGVAPFIPAGQPDSFSSAGFPVTQTPPDPSTSPHREPGADLVLISLGSSPPSSFPSKTLSSVSSLRSPTSPLMETPSPKLSASPQMSHRSLVSPSISRQTEQDLEGVVSPKTQTKRPGILKKPKLSPAAGEQSQSDHR